MTSLEGQIALVTGAGAGIGRAVALELARGGAAVAVHYHRSREGAEAVVAQVKAGGGKAIAVGGDLTKREDAERVVTQAAEGLGPIDILVNNAGDMVERRPFLEMTDDLWQKVFDLNVTSTFFCSQPVARAMVERKRGGAIVNMSSLAAHNGGGAGAGAYAMSKAAILGLTKAMAKELAPHGIRVNCVAPGLIGDTAFHGRFTPTDAFNTIAKGIPLGRAGTPEEVARVVLCLASEARAFLAGETIEINGGAWFR